MANINGTAANNKLTGTNSNDTINGLAGADTMTGLAGNDVYIVDNIADRVVEAVNKGIDTVRASVNYTLAANVENLELTGVNNLNATGNNLVNTLTGNSGNNTLNGMAGADTMIGADGNDTYIVDNAGDVVVENFGEGNDTVVSSVSYTLAADVENITLSGTAAIDATGNAEDNIITGNSGVNILDGGAGHDTLDGMASADTMSGGDGDDVYIVDNIGDVVVENAGEGYDEVRSSVSFTLDAEIEDLVLTGNANIHATGNDDVNTITGNSGNNTIDGGLGADDMFGGTGNDTYVVEDLLDAVTEDVSEGTDTVLTSIDYTLTANVENLTITTSGDVNATGNTEANVITGGDGNNVLSGLDGNDTLIGGEGDDTMLGGADDDTYDVDTVGDSIVELSNEGTDTVRSSITYALGADLENLVLTGTDNIDGTGNGFDNTITGNAGENIIVGGTGADTMIGGAGNDTYDVDDAGDVVTELANGGTLDSVISSVDYTLGANLEFLELVSTAVVGTGNALDNVLIGNTLANTLTGLAGHDTLDGSTGADSMIGGLGNDIYKVDDVGDVVVEDASEGTDTVFSQVTYTLGANIENLALEGGAAIDGTGNAGNNVISGNNAVNTLNGGGGVDTMSGNGGNDVYVVDSTTDVVIENAAEGTADLVRATVSYTLSDNVENLTFTDNAAHDGTGNAGVNTITGNTAINTLDGGAGADTLIGGGSNDYYIVDNIGDVVVELTGEGTDTVETSVDYTAEAFVDNVILSGTDDLSATGNALDNTLTGNSGDNSLDGGAGEDVMIGGAGNDVYYVENGDDIVSETLSTGGGTDTVYAALSYTATTNVENVILSAGGNLTLSGNAGVNTLTGNTGNNILDGKAGADRMVGGDGDDTYVVDNAGDVVVELVGEGTDLVNSSVSHTLTLNVEHLALTGTDNVNAIGNGTANSLTGNSGDNTLDGAVGADTMAGGLGDDVYIVDNVGDVVTETAGQGTDLIRSTVTFTASADVENLTLTGTDNVHATGNASANTLTGNDGNNTLDGAAGADRMIGGDGNDTYVVDNVSDVVVEGSLAGSGTDNILAGVSYTASANVENLTLTGAGDIHATGNGLVNILTGNTGNNSIDGGAGADTMIGGAGNDIYIVDNAGDTITELTGEGTDTVRSSVNYTAEAFVENVELTGTAISVTGNTLVNTLTGNVSNNTLDGGAGADTMIGDAGNDIYFVDDAGDVLIDTSGTDTVHSSITHTLGADFENLVLTAGNINGTGNTGNNTITGSTGNNVIDGGTGADRMVGGDGNDSYVVDNASDVVVESVFEGLDAVTSSVNYTLTANVENLTLTGAAVVGTGNAEDNSITGNANANTLDGGAGADTLIGSTGNDIYIIDNAGDAVVELTGEGTDTVRSSVSYTASAFVDNVVLTGSASIDATGNGDVNTLTGNTGNNTLDGGAGIDTMIGGAGNDAYGVDDSSDVITELAGQGTDTVRASITYVLSANLENLTLTGFANIDGTGTALDNVLTGNDGDNTLDGLAGNDTLDGGIGQDEMNGGIGNDSYVVDDASDLVVENASEGTDTVMSSIDFTLDANLENLTLTGSSDIDGTGNGVVNILIGNTGNNTLDGAAGADVMIGGAGDDTYVVDVIGDNIVEQAVGGGIDTVRTAISYTLGSNVEELILTGSANVNATGNTLNNYLEGNTGNNTLDGKAGADSMAGGDGDDVYIVDNAGDFINEFGNTGIDTILTGIGRSMEADVERLTLTGTASVDVLGNASDNTILGNSGNNTLDGGAGEDHLTGGLGNDTYVVDEALDVVVENAGQGTDTVQSSIDYTLQANLENLTLLGAALEGTGNNSNNVITGNASNNTLDGGAGNDTLLGGVGNDTYLVDSATDVVTELSAEGTDTIISSATSYTLVANVENLVLDAAALTGTGNSQNNTITGNAGDNTLDGGTGVDTLVGNDGDDIYLVEGSNDFIVENLNEGFDTVRSADTYTLGANVEALSLTGSAAVDAFGNALDNTLFGNAAENTLDGGVGADNMAGNNGNDTYLVDDAGDVVTENANQGTDTIISTVTRTLGANIENLYLDGGANINAIGNGLSNVLVGNSGNNTLNGNAGADYMEGGDGDDTYLVDVAGDVVVEYGLAGDDTVESTVSYTLGLNVENLTLSGSANINATGNALDNTLTGNTGNNSLDGGVGADEMIGGDGNDTYVVDDAGDVITELAAEGIDTVRTASSYVVEAFVENAVLTGTSSADLTGNGLDNVLTGNSGDNSLDGDAGVDTMIGGLGSDTYFVDDVADVVNEILNQGTDVVNASVTYTLSANVENLFLSGTDDIDATGNTLANTLVGNIGNNTLNGGAGADSMIGDDGDDTFVIDNAGDRVFDTLGTDTVLSSISYTLGADFENLTLTGAGVINGTGNAGDNTIIGNTAGNTLDGGAGADLLQGGAGNDFYLVDDLGDVVFEAASQGTDSVRSFVDFVLSADVERMALQGSADIDGTGNNLSNIITGNSGANSILGDAGADTLQGNAGNDFLYGQAGADLLTGGLGADTFVFESATAFALGSADRVTDFNRSQGDALDISDLLTGFDPINDAVTSFVRITTVGANSVVAVDADGAANGVSFVNIATLANVTGLTDETLLFNNNHLIMT